MLKRNQTSQSLLLNSLRGQQILPLNQKRLSPDAAATLCDIKLDDEGSTRRTLGLLPMPQSRYGHEITETDTLRLQMLLLSIESKKISCCLRVFSESTKSRSAVLIYRGRLIGCVYGKRGEEQHFGKQAFNKIMDDLVSQGNLLDTYKLTDELALAAAALFHGGLNQVFNGAPASEIYPKCARMVANNKRTGCIVCKDNGEGAISITYLFEGAIVGVYSFSEGWQTPTQTAALNTIDRVGGAELWLAVLPIETESAESLTESLTGLDFMPKTHGSK
ncbi:MAG TPA: hypothetical protein V6C97_31155 [Oculatellaceae cyanobacterium]